MMRRLTTLLLLLLSAAPSTQPATTQPTDPAILAAAAECLTFTAPPDTLLAATDPLVFKFLLAADPNYIPGYKGKSALFRPACAQRLEQLERDAERRRHAGTTRPWAYTFYITPFDHAPTLFLHERTSPAGHRRLVHVQQMGDNANQLLNSFDVTVIDPPTTTRPARTLTPPHGSVASGIYNPATLYFGQPDPHDPSHFTFTYTTHAWAWDPITHDPHKGPILKQGTIDAYLQDDDTVRFELHPSPTTTP